jgi:GMP synthase (glutamine-hydrolysing)
MRIHSIRHEPFEGLAYIENWIQSRGHTLSQTHVYLNQEFPEHTDFDFLIIMGGTASIYDSGNNAWLTDEKKFINNALDNNKKVLGICLGAQIIASTLGAKVYPGREKEIGWFPVRFESEVREKLRFLPEEGNVFHWHGDTYDIPDGATRLAHSSVTPNQGFIYKNNVIALQFHLEMTINSLKKLVKAAGRELMQKGNYIQSGDEILNNRENIVLNNNWMADILAYLESPVPVENYKDSTSAG